MSYIVLEMSGGTFGIYRREAGKLRTLVASGLREGIAKSIARRGNTEPMFPRDAVVRCGGAWH